MSTRFYLIGVLFLTITLPSLGSETIIDFETVPGALPVVGLPITTQYVPGFGVSFSMSDGSPFFLGDYGGSHQGWIDDNYVADVLQTGIDRGSFFAVYSDAAVAGRFLIVEYTTPSTAAGFDIIDIDDGPGNNPGYEEEWTIRVFDASNVLLQTKVIRAGEPGTGDALPTRVPIEFGGAAVIKRLEIEYTGDAATSPGLAFDNFTPYTTVPGPTIEMREPWVRPDDVHSGSSGVPSLKLLWTEKVLFSADDIVITDGSGENVLFSLGGSNPQFMNIAFEKVLLNDKYTIRIRDSVVSAETEAPIDGDNDGNAGGDAVLVMEHRNPFDHDRDNDVDQEDFGIFQRCLSGPDMPVDPNCAN